MLTRLAILTNIWVVLRKDIFKMTINEEIITVANALYSKGKKPTVALVKNKLSQPTPLPTIIAVLKTWQYDPNFSCEPTKPKKQISPSKSEENIQDLISQAIKPLHDEIAELKLLITQALNRDK